MIDFTEIKQKLQPPASRELLVEIIASGMNTGKAIKALAYISVQRMSQAEIDAMAGLALHAIGYIEREDLKGLQNFLKECKIPEQVATLIISYSKSMIDKYNAKDQADK